MNKVKNQPVLFFSLIVLAFYVYSCSKGGSDNGGNGGGGGGGVDCSTVQAKFTANVNPIIQTRCATNSGCHGTGSTNGPGALTSYAVISANASAINSAVQNNVMPKGGPYLSASDKAIIQCWVNSGAPNN